LGDLDSRLEVFDLLVVEMAFDLLVVEMVLE
jgi:hypothetical protein